MKKTRQIVIRIEEDLYDALEKTAERHERTVAQEVRYRLRRSSENVRLELRPGETLVIFLDHHPTRDEVDRLKADARHQSGRPMLGVLVFGPSTTLATIHARPLHELAEDVALADERPDEYQARTFAGKTVRTFGNPEPVIGDGTS